MSSLSHQMNTAPSHMAMAPYTPVDSINRHEYGVQKNRKTASTGGGRAWSEDEEVYLLQTRLQKMPYKHIAAHLKKTELACRLHYHQLSHGSNRRKRASSVASSNTGSAAASPVMPVSMPSPMRDNLVMRQGTPSYTYSPQSAHVQLPSASLLLNRSATNSPSRILNHPVAILPKPSPPRRSHTDSAVSPPLRLDCGMGSSVISTAHIDQERLRHIYEAHRASFWSVVAHDYGAGVSAYVLEEAWKHNVVTNAPPTPCVSPDTNSYRPTYQPSHHVQQLPTPVHEVKPNSATSISALLGIDASPRSPEERELIKMIEERRNSRDAMVGVEIM